MADTETVRGKTVNKNPRPANWPPEATPEAIAAHVEKIAQRNYKRDNGRLVYVPEGHSVYVFRSNDDTEHDGRSAD